MFATLFGNADLVNQQATDIRLSREAVPLANNLTPKPGYTHNFHTAQSQYMKTLVTSFNKTTT